MPSAAETVICYSGARYGERPVALDFEQERCQVVQVEKSWREPAGLGFVVRVADHRPFRLLYDEQSDHWSVELLEPGGMSG